ncbi:hypothetical protein KPL70_011249 [Citrus sinensis]|nr:hypothetical protein KPL70_011249 [Citrus sinensis]
MGLPIHNVGCVAVKTLSTTPIYLNHVLHVPTITKNLISVSRLLADNNVFIEFHNHVCFVKDKNSRITLLKGIARGGLNKVTNLNAVCDNSSSVIRVSNSSESVFNSISTLSTAPVSMFTQLSSFDIMSHPHMLTAVQLDRYFSQSSPSAIDLPSNSYLSNSKNHFLSHTPSPINHQSSPQPIHQLSPHSQPIVGHSMITWSKMGIFKPKKAYLVECDSKSTKPLTFSTALNDPKWLQAMREEYQALVNNQTWTLVQPTYTVKVVGNKWVFRIKYNADGSVSRYKARLVAKGFLQTQGIDYNKTFSPVVKASTVKLILSLAVLNHWSLRQVDINDAFLNGYLTKEVYVQQPEGFLDQSKPTHICKLKKTLYGLKQAPRAWFDRLKVMLTKQWGFKNSKSDTSMFFHRIQGHLLLVLVYVDDIIVTVIKTDTGLHLSQSKYIADLLNKVKMQVCTPCSTPMAANVPLTKTDSELFADATLYRSTIGALQYATLIRSEIAFLVNKLSQFLTTPTINLKGTMHMGLQYSNQSPLHIDCFSDADWAADRDDRKYLFTLVLI